MALHVTSLELVRVLPRVLIVSRRTVRKNKFVDFVGEYHLDLILKYGAVPVIVPRVCGLDELLDSFEPIHGVLLCEGEDVDPSLYDNDTPSLSIEEIEEIRNQHSSDTSIDKDKDSIEMRLARRCLERNIPFLGICRGSQILNVACGGSLYQDVERELGQKQSLMVKHIDYNNYDGHRHPIHVVKDTPLHDWFQGSLQGDDLVLNVNSYHHQGVKKLAARFKPMAHSPCSLTEAFYDPDVYNPEAGKFIVGLQFHPERMRHEQDVSGNGNCAPSESVFDYPECPRAYQEFVKAVKAYQKKLLNLTPVKKELPKVTFNTELEKQRQEIVQSFCLAKHIYNEKKTLRRNYSMHGGRNAFKALEAFEPAEQKVLEIGANFLKSSRATLNSQQEKMLKQVGVTIRDSFGFSDRMNQLKNEERKARLQLSYKKTHELHDLLDVYKMMVRIASDILESREDGNIKLV